MTIKEIKERSTEDLIFLLVQFGSKETQKAYKTERKIFRELENRNIISFDKMEDVYSRHFM